MTSTVQQVLNTAKKQLMDSVDDPYTDSQVLLAHITGRNRAWIIAHADDVLDAGIVDEYAQLIRQRQQGRPVAHIIGSREFWSMPFTVSEETLIPRPETEHLIEQVLSLDLPMHASVLDYGTGSGIIAVVLATERPDWKITAIECSAGALAIARENARRHQVTVNFVQACGLESNAGQALDLIVSNPPYIREDDEHLHQGDVRFEPRTALVSGSDGLDCIRYLVSSAPACLAPLGYLALEHGYDQAQSVRALMSEHGYTEVTTARDHAGHDRITYAQWTGK